MFSFATLRLSEKSSHQVSRYSNARNDIIGSLVVIVAA